MAYVEKKPGYYTGPMRSSQGAPAHLAWQAAVKMPDGDWGYVWGYTPEEVTEKIKERSKEVLEDMKRRFEQTEKERLERARRCNNR